MNVKTISIFKLVGALLTIFILIGCDKPANEKKNVEALSAPIQKQNAEKEPQQLRQVILTLGSWRIEDVEQVNTVLKEFTKKYPHIVVKFDPTTPSHYNDALEAQLETETAPDLFYLRSFSQSQKLYKKGYLVTLDDMATIHENFPPEMLVGWSSDEGHIYGVPLMSVSHGIYYNATLFDELNLSVPNTWEELLALSEHLKNINVLPFANATGDLWTINGLILQNLIPGFIGGEKARLEYYNGTRCFNDEDMVSAFQAIRDISRYVHPNQKLLKYGDSSQLFLQGKAAMLFGGSWDIPFFEEQDPAFDWRVFAIPPPAGKEFYVTVHPDAGIGLNSASPYIEEAKLFLQWTTTEEFASLFTEQLPGFFSINKNITESKNQHANMFLDFANKYKTDIRIWGKIPKYGEPSAYAITRQSSVDVMNQVITPKEAADKLQEGLASWYIPAQRCKND